MIQVRIEPTPTPDEAAAIEAALVLLGGRAAAGPRRLRYADVANGCKLDARAHGIGPAEPAGMTGDLASPSWRDAARIESLDSGV